jgi:hypothetical protein
VIITFHRRVDKLRLMDVNNVHLSSAIGTFPDQRLPIVPIVCSPARVKTSQTALTSSVYELNALLVTLTISGTLATHRI